jgi:hypothetical protein
MNADITYSGKSMANIWQEIQKFNFPIDVLENLGHIRFDTGIFRAQT